MLDPLRRIEPQELGPARKQLLDCQGRLRRLARAPESFDQLIDNSKVELPKLSRLVLQLCGLRSKRLGHVVERCSH